MRAPGCIGAAGRRVDDVVLGYAATCIDVADLAGTLDVERAGVAGAGGGIADGLIDGAVGGDCTAGYLAEQVPADITVGTASKLDPAEPRAILIGRAAHAWVRHHVACREGKREQIQAQFHPARR